MRRASRQRPGGTSWLLALAVFALIVSFVPVPRGGQGPGAPVAGGTPAPGPTRSASGFPAAPWVTLPSSPHPDPLSSRPTGYNGHYYVGTQYSGSPTTATDLAVNLRVPQDDPQMGDFYYVLLSVWDSAQSYDQIGFTSSSGVWGLAYSTTTPCASSYSFSTDAYNLAGGTDYRFDMRLVAGNVVFTVSLPSGASVWTYSANTGASQFVLEGMYSCNGGSSYDYTDYEEVYTTAAPVPPYTFFFSNNTEDSASETQWATWETSNAPAVITAVTGGSEGVVENTPFDLAAPPTLAAEIDPAGRTYSENVSVSRYAMDSTLTVSLTGNIPNGLVSRSPTSGSAPFAFALRVFVNNSTQPGLGYPIEVVVSDSQGVYARILVNVEVDPTLAASVPVARPASTDVNVSIALTENPIGGSGTYAFLWSGLPTGCAAGSSTVVCVPARAGSYPVAVEVSDSFGYFANSSTMLLVVHPALGLVVVANRSALDTGQSVDFSAATTGGSGGFQYSWTSGPGNYCTPAGPLLSCVARSPGPLAISATVTDLSGARTSGTGSTTVYSDPTVSLKASRTAGEVGVAVTLVPTATGGLAMPGPPGGPPSYGRTWTGIPANCTDVPPMALECVWSDPGTYLVTVAVFDANQFVSSATSVTIEVRPAVSVAVAIDPPSPIAGGSITLRAVIAGGSAPFQITWTGLPSGCHSLDAANVSCAVATPGNFGIGVSVRDALGANASGAASFSVQPGFLGLPYLEGYSVLGAGLAGLAIAVAIGVRARRRRHRNPDAPGAGDAGT